FYIVKNHPFVDGNKRTGLMAMLAFLGLNNMRLEATDDDFVDLVMGVAAGRITKAEIAVFVRRHRQRRPGRRCRAARGGILTAPWEGVMSPLLSRVFVVVLAAFLLMRPAAPTAAAPEGTMTWGVHITLASRWLDPAETEGIITPFMVLYGL